jgi:DNA-binding phage protein
MAIKGPSIEEAIREAVRRDGRGIVEIANAADIAGSSMSRFMNGGSLHITSVDRILRALGYRFDLVKERRAKR